MHWSVDWLIIFASLIILFVIGMPIGFSMILVSLVGLMLTAGLDYVLNMSPVIVYTKATPYVFICIPLFVLMTEFMTHGGISTKLIDISYKLMGRIPGSLAVAAVAASTVFGAMCTSTVIGAMIMGDMLFPETTKRNYDKSLMAGAIAAGGTLSVLIPPSGTFILWGIIAGVGVGDLFIAGIVPGILAAAIFMTYIVIRAKRNPALAPMVPASPWKEKAMAVVSGWDILLLIVVILGGIYGGYFTVVEMSAIGALAALIIGLVHGELFSLSKIYFCFKRSAEMVGSFIVLLMGAFLLINLMSYLEIPQSLADVAVDADLSADVLILVVMVMFFLLGMFIDAASVMLITLPLFLPTLRLLEVDLLWLGVIVTLNAMIATLTPPVGLNLFIIQAVGRPHGISFSDVARGSVPFIILLFIVVGLVWAFPSLATWLPSTMN